MKSTFLAWCITLKFSVECYGSHQIFYLQVINYFLMTKAINDTCSSLIYVESFYVSVFSGPPCIYEYTCLLHYLNGCI